MYDNNLVLGNYFDTGLRGEMNVLSRFQIHGIPMEEVGIFFCCCGTSEIQKWGLLGFYAFFVHHSILSWLS